MHLQNIQLIVRLQGNSPGFQRRVTFAWPDKTMVLIFPARVQCILKTQDGFENRSLFLIIYFFPLVKVQTKVEPRRQPWLIDLCGLYDPL